MRRLLIAAIAVLSCSAAMWAQKFALVDMEYVLKNIPAYDWYDGYRLGLRCRHRAQPKGRKPLPLCARTGILITNFHHC